MEVAAITLTTDFRPMQFRSQNSSFTKAVLYEIFSIVNKPGSKQFRVLPPDSSLSLSCCSPFEVQSASSESTSGVSQHLG